MIRVHLVQVDTLTRSICCIRFPAIVFVAMCISCSLSFPRLSELILFFLLHFIQVVCVSTTMQVHKKCDCIDISAKCTLKHVVAVARTCGMPLMAVMTKKSLSKTISKYFKSNTNQIEPAMVMAMGWALNDRWFWITTATASQTTTAAKNAMVQKISILEIEWIFTWHWYRCFCFVPN